MFVYSGYPSCSIHGIYRQELVAFRYYDPPTGQFLILYNFVRDFWDYGCYGCSAIEGYRLFGFIWVCFLPLVPRNNSFYHGVANPDTKSYLLDPHTVKPYSSFMGSTQSSRPLWIKWLGYDKTDKMASDRRPSGDTLRMRPTRSTVGNTLKIPRKWRDPRMDIGAERLVPGKRARIVLVSIFGTHLTLNPTRW